jgi:hypothetical protein
MILKLFQILLKGKEKFEYKTISELFKNTLMNELNVLGGEGWEVIFIEREQFNDKNYIAVLKRKFKG